MTRNAGCNRPSQVPKVSSVNGLTGNPYVLQRTLFVGTNPVPYSWCIDSLLSMSLGFEKMLRRQFQPPRASVLPRLPRMTLTWPVNAPITSRTLCPSPPIFDVLDRDHRCSIVTVYTIKQSNLSIHPLPADVPRTTLIHSAPMLRCVPSATKLSLSSIDIVTK